MSQGFSIFDIGAEIALLPFPLLARALGFRGQERGRAGDGVRRTGGKGLWKDPPP